MDKQKFYEEVRAKLFGNKLSESQVDGIERYLNAGVDNIKHLSYILATIYHETAKTMQPIEEFGKGKGKEYGKLDPRTGQVYYGRGDVQITWYDNYKKFSDLLGIDLVKFPEKALNPDTSVKITLLGMEKGLFTGKKLSDYINDSKTDFVGARRIINGTDKADLIAGYATTFYNALI